MSNKIKKTKSYLILLSLIIFITIYMVSKKGIVHAKGGQQEASEAFVQGKNEGREDIPVFNEKDISRKEWDDLNQKVINAYSKGDYTEGVKWAKKTLEYANKHFGPKHPNTLTILNNLAGLYLAQGHYGEAEPLLKKALWKLGCSKKLHFSALQISSIVHDHC